MLGTQGSLRSGPQLYRRFANLVRGIQSEAAEIADACRSLIVLRIVIGGTKSEGTPSRRLRRPRVVAKSPDPTPTGNSREEAYSCVDSRTHPMPPSNSARPLSRVVRREVIGSRESPVCKMHRCSPDVHQCTTAAFTRCARRLRSWLADSRTGLTPGVTRATEPLGRSATEPTGRCRVSCVPQARSYRSRSNPPAGVSYIAPSCSSPPLAGRSVSGSRDAGC